MWGCTRRSHHNSAMLPPLVCHICTSLIPWPCYNLQNHPTYKGALWTYNFSYSFAEEETPSEWDDAGGVFYIEPQLHPPFFFPFQKVWPWEWIILAFLASDSEWKNSWVWYLLVPGKPELNVAAVYMWCMWSVWCNSTECSESSGGMHL